MSTVNELFDAANLAELHGEYAKANDFYARLLAIQPDYPEAYFNRAGNWEQLGEYETAISDYYRVLNYWPDDASALELLAAIYLLQEFKGRNPSKARELAQRACELCQFGQWQPVRTLASAHAACHDYTEAIKMQELAINLVGSELEADYFRIALDRNMEHYRRRLQESRSFWIRIRGFFGR